MNPIEFQKFPSRDGPHMSWHHQLVQRHNPERGHTALCSHQRQPADIPFESLQRNGKAEVGVRT